ncbi:tripartite tricarboxylate transporter permease [Sutterella sp. AM11-39]|uniref:tripartite tricarboxylate transporter permease n=1 Tax=Sutterella sp. AM11-39 TaxID=2292075 RepID=UPI000E46A553|nr:tripartite tricarboxylate transporter permease [Sutterella sp. AM11-39]RHJ31826.1 tripartite tricarboxylate transporter permease [Sutterella sp. AM11-39]
MGLISNLMLGFDTALSLQNILYCTIGVTIGTLIGVLPGMGPVATVAMLLPATYALPPTSALIMLAGIYYGASYGGSTTAILVNIPGEASAVVTCLDGHMMAKRGRAGSALGIAALGSFFAGCVATLLIAAFAPPLTELAFQFGPAEYFSLMVLGLVSATVLATGSLLKAICMVLLGLLLGLIGTDVNSGAFRFTFGLDELQDGIDFVPLSMGLFGFAEIMRNLEGDMSRSLVPNKVKNILPSWQEIKVSMGPIVRGTALGSILGVLPGGGALLSSFASYTAEKKLAGDKADPPFGYGNIRGVAGPESANNAGAQTSFVPMLTLGIPSNAVMALMIGAMMIHDIVPGPQVMQSDPGLFWGLIISMWIGNLILVVLNLPMIGVWVQLLRVPYRWLFPAILVFCCIGVYSINNNVWDVWIAIFFGFAGYVFGKLGCETAPLVLGFILGPMMEENLRRAMLLSRGDPSVFVSSPISCGLLIAAVLMVFLVAAPAFRKTREVAFKED